MRLAALLLSLSFALSSVAMANPYSAARGQNAPTVAVEKKVTLDDGTVETRTVQEAAAADSWGNAAGNQFDLVVDGAFEGQTIAVLHFYALENFDFSLPKEALGQKGFNVVRWVNQPPPPDELKKGLEKANQLWIIADASRHLSEAHLDVIEAYFESGHGVYIWGDNEPYYADANAVAERLFGGGMDGNLPGTVTVNLRRGGLDQPGLTVGHDITTGLEHLYEGITIATIRPNEMLSPLVVGSAGNLVTAVYDHDGKRAVLDGGFTRLYINWDTAGTARYVKNAAAWLANYERFGDEVVAHNDR